MFKEIYILSHSDEFKKEGITLQVIYIVCLSIVLVGYRILKYFSKKANELSVFLYQSSDKLEELDIKIFQSKQFTEMESLYFEIQAEVDKTEKNLKCQEPT